MTKAKMRQYLRYKLEQLDKTKEPEKFYAIIGELFFKLRSIPNNEDRQENFNNSMDIWEGHFYGYAKRVEFHHKMRKVSSNKKYQVPSLGVRFKRGAYDLIKISIDWSLLPKK